MIASVPLSCTNNLGPLQNIAKVDRGLRMVEDGRLTLFFSQRGPQEKSRIDQIRRIAAEVQWGESCGDMRIPRIWHSYEGLASVYLCLHIEDGHFPSFSRALLDHTSWPSVWSRVAWVNPTQDQTWACHISKEGIYYLSISRNSLVKESSITWIFLIEKVPIWIDIPRVYYMEGLHHFWTHHVWSKALACLETAPKPMGQVLSPQ